MQVDPDESEVGAQAPHKLPKYKEESSTKGDSGASVFDVERINDWRRLIPSTIPYRPTSPRFRSGRSTQSAGRARELRQREAAGQPAPRSPPKPASEPIPEVVAEIDGIVLPEDSISNISEPEGDDENVEEVEEEILEAIVPAPEPRREPMFPPITTEIIVVTDRGEERICVELSELHWVHQAAQHYRAWREVGIGFPCLREFVEIFSLGRSYGIAEALE